MTTGRDLTIAIDADIRGLERGLAQAQASTRRYESQIQRTSTLVAQASKEIDDEIAASAKKREQAFTQTGQAMLGIGLAAAAGVAVAVSKFVEFDKQMSAVAATGDEAAGSIDALRQAALDAGAATAFSASEAAQGIEELAKAGISTSDIMGGALAGSLDLAAAGAISVAEAAETTATALSVFELDGDQAAHVADLLAAGAGKAQGSVSQLGQALNQSALVAKQAGLSVEDTSGALALFASNGLLGSDAGTSFRTMLLALQNPSKESRSLMEELGLTFYDAQGQFIGVAGVADQLQTRLGGLTQETRNQALAQIFGNDAVRAAGLLFKEGAEGVEEWTANVNDAGYAAEVAATRLDNLAGDWEALTGSIETALIGMGEGADGPLRASVQTLTEWVNTFNNLPGPVKQATLLVAGLTAGVGLLGGAALIMAPKVKAGIETFRDLGITADAAKGKIGLLAKSATILGAAFAATELMDWLGELHNWTANVDDLAKAMDRLGKTGQVSGELVDVFGGNLEKLGARLNSSTDGFNHMVDEFEGNNDGIHKVDEALAAMVEQGRVEEARRAFNTIAAAAAEQGATFQDVTGHLTKYSDALDDSGTSITAQRDDLVKLATVQRQARDGAEGLGDGMAVAKDVSDDLAESYQTQVEEMPELDDAQRRLADRFGITAQQAIDLAGAMDEVKRQQDILTGANVSAIETQAAWEQAIDDADAALADYKAAQEAAAESGETLESAILANGAGFDLSSQSGRDLNASLLDMRDRALENADAIFDLTGNENDYRTSLEDARTALYDKAIEYGLTEDAAKLYVDQILLIPEDRVTTVSFDDAVARARLAEFKTALDQALARRTLYVDVEWVVPGPPAGYGQGGISVPPGSGDYLKDDRRGAYSAPSGERVYGGGGPAGVAGTSVVINKSEFVVDTRQSPTTVLSELEDVVRYGAPEMARPPVKIAFGRG